MNGTDDNTAVDLVDAVNESQTSNQMASSQEAPSSYATPSTSKAPMSSVSQASVMPSQAPPAQGTQEISLVYALGTIGYDFGSEAHRDSFGQAMGDGASPDDPRQLMGYLEEHPYECARVIWTLNQDATPIYAVWPSGTYADVVYERLCEFLDGQMREGVQRVSVPGMIAGQARLLSGQEVPIIRPVVRGMYSWSTEALVEAAVVGGAPEEEEEKAQYELKRLGVHNFLERVYYELRNLGLSSQERAMNFAATNVFQVGKAFEEAAREGMELDSMGVERSPVCRPGSDCWDVKLVFFDPAKRLERARKAYRLTVDVSDVLPVTVGTVRSWSVY